LGELGRRSGAARYKDTSQWGQTISLGKGTKEKARVETLGKSRASINNDVGEAEDKDDGAEERLKAKRAQSIRN
jgi:hypothetical protein